MASREENGGEINTTETFSLMVLLPLLLLLLSGADHSHCTSLAFFPKAAF